MQQKYNRMQRKELCLSWLTKVMEMILSGEKTCTIIIGIKVKGKDSVCRIRCRRSRGRKMLWDCEDVGGANTFNKGQCL